MEKSRFAEARAVVESLLDSLEIHCEPISQCLMKAKRLARLTKDADAQTWLDFEMKGYPMGFALTQVGYCVKYMRESRLSSDGKYKIASLPEIEAEIQGLEKHMEAVRFPSSISTTGPQTPGPFHMDSMSTLVHSVNLTIQGLRDSRVDRVRMFEALRSALHSYATDCQISLQFGDISSDVFEKARDRVELFIRAVCPKAAGQLLAVYERLTTDDGEARAQCLTTCRRILLTVADAVYPPEAAEYRDRNGKVRKVGPEEYKNRILAFLDGRLESDGTYRLVLGEIEHLAARLDGSTTRYRKESIPTCLPLKLSWL